MQPDDKAPKDDAALFRAAVGEVQPLSGQNRIALRHAPRKAYIPGTGTAVEIADTLSDTFNENPPDEFISNGLSRMTLRKLRRNRWPTQDKLDLHGLRSDAARRLLLVFLQQAMERKSRCVLVVHGKGLNSPNGEAVLKMRTRHWLMQHPGVLAYCDASPKDGGGGAVLILLSAKP